MHFVSNALCDDLLKRMGGELREVARPHLQMQLVLLQ